MSSGYPYNPSHSRQYPSQPYPHYANGGGITAASKDWSRSPESDASSNSITNSHSQPQSWTSPGSSPDTIPPGRYNRQYSGQGQAGPPHPTNSHSGTGVNHQPSRRTNKPQHASGGQQTRYPCLWPRCEYTAARAYDLGRHVNTHTPETTQRLDCPYARNGFCGREGERGFTRDDHRKEHIRKVHPRPR